MQILIAIAEGGADPERLDYLIHGVRSELLQLDVDAVEPVQAEALLVSLAASDDALTQMMTALRSWVGRNPAPRAVEMSVGDRRLRISDASLDQQDLLVDEFVRAVRVS